MSKAITMILSTKIKSYNYFLSVFCIITVFAIFFINIPSSLNIYGVLALFASIAFSVYHFILGKRDNEYNNRISKIIQEIQKDKKQGLESLVSFCLYQRNELTKQTENSKRMLMEPDTYYGRLKKLELSRDRVNTLESARDLLEKDIKGNII
ncbi:hypothetical protein KQ51_00846 [Candidatus Izimaplasma bacterium HR1]|uniref:hypothetical protein n=1 Tax=Candidatus Izimoplasma sp. HR1 TaxID=1541959 RepID=UPI0004F6E004|nr:hypothetical protein KQ51_00846 [Candidatus Izimaplasma bacterium HR1]